MVKAKIGKGVLRVKRGDKFKTQRCLRLDGGATCGDWCPLFGEVVLEAIPATKLTGVPVKAVINDVLTICEGVKFEIVEEES